MAEVTKVRVDKWLWCVRLFKTRTLATDAISGNIVKLNGDIIKPGRAAKVGDIITFKRGVLNRTVKITKLLDKRVGAPLVNEYLEDLTPQEEYDKATMQQMVMQGSRDRGAGRPTKKDRRSLDTWGEWD